MVQKKVKLCIIALLTLIFLTGYTWPADGIWVLAKINGSDPIQVYFASNYNGYLSYNEQTKQLINTYSSTIYGYQNYFTNSSGNNVSIYFPTHQTPYYTVNSRTTTVDTFEIIENHGLKFFTRFDSDMTTYIGIAILFLLVFLLFKG